MAGLLVPDHDSGDVHGAAFGFVASILTVIVVLAPGRDLPDRAIGVREGRPPEDVHSVPVVAFGWLLAAVGAIAALLVAGVDDGLFAAAMGAVAPLALARSLNRFLSAAGNG